ncbi:MAG: hypothetical protein F8N37_12175 [Telmatospirillum sp.]|nr:hypothetical protein [Telmatospirillum sp.]
MDITPALAAADAAMPVLGRKLDRDRRHMAAQHYDRWRCYTLETFLHPALLREARADMTDPRVTWRVIRSLCASLRYHRAGRSRVFSGVCESALRTLITCELHLLARQKGRTVPYVFLPFPGALVAKTAVERRAAAE